MRPIAHARDEPMLDRIDVAIFDMARVIGFVADQVFPETALPDAALVAGNANGAAPLAFRKRLREPALDQSPARREIAIAWRQPPDRMQMIGQHDERGNFEAVGLPRRGDGLAQISDMLDKQGLTPAAKQKLYINDGWRWLLVTAIFGIGAVVVLIVAAIEVGFWIALFSR